MFIPKIIPTIPASQCRDDPPGTGYSITFPVRRPTATRPLAH